MPVCNKLVKSIDLASSKLVLTHREPPPPHDIDYDLSELDREHVLVFGAPDVLESVKPGFECHVEFEEENGIKYVVALTAIAPVQATRHKRRK